MSNGYVEQIDRKDTLGKSRTLTTVHRTIATVGKELPTDEDKIIFDNKFFVSRNDPLASRLSIQSDKVSICFFIIYLQ